MKILFFPLLTMPSGHHQVADTLANNIQLHNENVVCKKIDILSEWNPHIERLVTRAYLEWIHYFPKTYAWVYKKMAYTNRAYRPYHYYNRFFLNKIKKIIENEKPTLIICTHAFPSYLLNQLKIKRLCDVPVVNVYTDFFINDVWGKGNIDYHFVPTTIMKEELIEKTGLAEERIFVTGIPVDEQFYRRFKTPKRISKWNVLISGGSNGLGNIVNFLQKEQTSEQIQYFVLCGNNKKLFEKIANLQSDTIFPLPYISSRGKMLDLYRTADAIITKPGGVTISEALHCQIPIFIHSALPGQEEINLAVLKKLNLVYELHRDTSLEQQLINFFDNRSQLKRYYLTQHAYVTNTDGPTKVTSLLSSLLKERKSFPFVNEKKQAFL